MSQKMLNSSFEYASSSACICASSESSSDDDNKLSRRRSNRLAKRPSTYADLDTSYSSEDDEYEVLAIIDHRFDGVELEVLIEWRMKK